MSEFKDGIRPRGLGSRKGIKISFPEVRCSEEEVLSLLYAASGSIVYPISAALLPTSPSKLALLFPFFFLPNKPMGNIKGVEKGRLALSMLQIKFSVVSRYSFVFCSFCPMVSFFRALRAWHPNGTFRNLYGRFYEKATIWRKSRAADQVQEKAQTQN